MRGRRGTGWIAVILVVTCTVTACTAQPAPDASASAFVADLAAAGVAVYPDDASDENAEPLAAVSDPAFGVLESQAEAMKAEADAGNGLTGAMIDSLVEPTALADGAEALPPSLLLLAWARSADTAASRLADRVLQGQPEEAASIVFPTVVLALFAADVAADVVGAQEASDPDAFGEAPRIVLAAAAQVAAPSICEQALGFVDSLIDRFFQAIGKVSYVGVSGGFFAKILGFIVNIGVSIVNYGIDRIQAFVKDGVRVLLAPVLSIVARVASVAAIVAHVFSSVRPWQGRMEAAPLPIVLGAASVPGSVTLRVSAPGPNDWPPHVKGCAAVAGVELPSLLPNGAAVRWSIERQSPTQLVEAGEEDARLGEGAAATWRYDTVAEDAETAAGDVAEDGALILRAEVRRDDLTELQTLITDQILSFIPAVVAKYVAPVIRALLTEQLEKLRAGLANLHDIIVRSSVAATYHVAKPADVDDVPGGDDGGAVPVGIPMECPPAAYIGAAEGPWSVNDVGCGYDPPAAGEYYWLLDLDVVPKQGLEPEAGMVPVDFAGADRAYAGCASGACGMMIVSGDRYLNFVGPPTPEQTERVVRLILTWGR